MLFIGDKGKILCTFNGGNPQIIPQSKMDAYKQPPKTLPRSPGNEREWLDACKGGKTKPGGNFEFEGHGHGDTSARECCDEHRATDHVGPREP